MVERAISVRLDEEAQRALDKLIGSGMSQSKAIRYALIQTADRERPRISLSAEAMMLAANEEDRRIKVELLEFMGEPSESR
ncbi:MAG: ribbon-helix-helix protein, CopG family [Actinomycetota bacterium]